MKTKGVSCITIHWMWKGGEASQIRGFDHAGRGLSSLGAEVMRAWMYEEALERGVSKSWSGSKGYKAGCSRT